ncbi:DNA-directed RNA polymerase subunit omega [Clostridium sp. Sa3CUN1]|uniref:DNA-directed RNA polymerase subunit omega n=1 Tax=Clostridium gallinarum TaxID=2762246 RepID=A0ABR8Q138_9CLOT|nr:DNA-directed RNA polymerase subunit omega [Clostridium gallinarum]MBD7914122.1 DNA-directed RNA polymerase subunit omega [Clostridium gallinarum]
MNNSMINPSIMDLLQKVDDRYSLVIVTSKRARQLIDGREPLVVTKSKKPLTIAINEVNAGEVGYESTVTKEGNK